MAYYWFNTRTGKTNSGRFGSRQNATADLKRWKAWKGGNNSHIIVLDEDSPILNRRSVPKRSASVSSSRRAGYFSSGRVKNYSSAAGYRRANRAWW